MLRLSRFAAISGCAAASLLAGCAASDGLAPPSGITGAQWIHAGGVVYHVSAYMPTRSARAATSGGLEYNGGPVLVTPKAYIVFWGYKKWGDPDKVEQLLESYCKAQGGSGHNNIYTQYYEVVGSQKTYIENPRNQCGGFYDDDKDAVPPHPTDAQVAAEAARGAAKFGYDPNGSYVVATPDQRSGLGFGTQWCAYDGAVYSDGNLVVYTNLPYMPNAGGNCGADFIAPPKDESGADEGVTIIEGVMYGDSVIDPVPGTGWSGEGGDICAWENVQNDKFHTKSYTMQPMYSNASESCVQSYK